MFGDIAGTQYSLIITWGMMLLGLAGLVTSTLLQNSYSYRAKDDKIGLIRFTLFAMRLYWSWQLPSQLHFCAFFPTDYDYLGR